MRLSVVSVIAVGLLLALVGRPVEGQAPVELRVSSNEDFQNLDPAQLFVAGDRLVVQNVYDGLVKFKRGTTEVEPALARSYTVSPDGRVYTFTLRQGVQFHKGYGELTAADVKFTLERHLDPATRSRERITYDLVERVEAPDRYTVRIHLKQPSAALLGALAWQSGFIMSERATRERGREIGTDPIGTGPFMVESWVRGERMVLAANPQYYGGPPKAQRLTIRVIPEDIVALYALLQGELDIVPIRQIGAWRQLQRLQTRLTIHSGPSGWQNWVYVQTQKSPTDDVTVRRAIQCALDINVMVEALAGMIVPNTSIFNPLIPGWTDRTGACTANLARARELLRGRRPTLKLIYTKAHLFEDFSLIVKDQLAPIATVNVEVVDRALQIQKMREGDWNLGVWATTRLEADQYLSPFLHSKGGSNFSRYNDPELDRLIEAAKTEVDPAKRAQLHVQIQRRVAEMVPIITTGTMRSIVATRQEVTGIVPHPFVGLLDLENATLTRR
jgi:peptide/nickel transport system substrate-binding protein